MDGGNEGIHQAHDCNGRWGDTMAMKIDASTLLEKCFLKVRDHDVVYYRSVFIGGGQRTFRYEQIDCILMSPAGELSLQVGQETFTLATKRAKRQHQRAIEHLLERMRTS